MAATTEHRTGEIARRRLMAAVADLDLTEAETRTLRWLLMTCELQTLDNVASMIEKARAA